jgi:hypothetical protein
MLVCLRRDRKVLGAVLRELPPGLDPLYDLVMEQILAQKYTQAARFCKDLLQSATLAY